jgi:hypothetical protein
VGLSLPDSLKEYGYVGQIRLDNELTTSNSVREISRFVNGDHSFYGSQKNLEILVEQ